MTRSEAIELIVKYGFSHHKKVIKLLMEYDPKISVSENARKMKRKINGVSSIVRKYKLKCHKQANGWGGTHYSTRKAEKP